MVPSMYFYTRIQKRYMLFKIHLYIYANVKKIASRYTKFKSFFKSCYVKTA